MNSKDLLSAYFGFVYKWTNRINGKMYIGSHAGTIDDGYVGSGRAFAAAIKKYGIHNFDRVILEYVYVRDRRFLLSREKFYLDDANAYHSKEYYNIAKDVIGGDTKAGWSDERRLEFGELLSSIWENRSDEEKSRILANSRIAFRELMKIPENRQIRRDALASNRDKVNAGIRARDPADRSRSAKLGKSRMGKDRIMAAIEKGVANRTPESVARGHQKAKATRDSRSDARRLEIYNNMSSGRKGKCVGENNGRARQVVAAGIVFATLREAIKTLKIAEATLYKRLKDPAVLDYYYVID